MRRFAASLVLLVLGCGPGSPGADDGQGETTGCEAMPAEIPPIDMPEVCTAYLGEPTPVGGEIDVVITNSRDEAILLLNQSRGCQPPLQWFHVDGEFQGHAVWLPMDACEDEWPSCRSFTDDSPACSLCETFHLPIYIEPGGRFVTSWTSVVALEVELPAACTSAGEAVQCWAPTALPPWTYQLRVVAALASDCTSADCSCEVDEDGSCVAPDFPTKSDLEATLEWGTECDQIELTFTK